MSLGTIPDDLVGLIVSFGEPLAQRAVQSAWKAAADGACGKGWAALMQRHAREYLASVRCPTHVPDNSPCRPEPGLFLACAAPGCINMRHYVISGQHALRFLLSHAMPTEYDIETIRSRAAGLVRAQQELERTRRALLDNINSQLQRVADEREQNTARLRRAFTTRRKLFNLLLHYPDVCQPLM